MKTGWLEYDDQVDFLIILDSVEFKLTMHKDDVSTPRGRSILASWITSIALMELDGFTLSTAEKLLDAIDQSFTAPKPSYQNRIRKWWPYV